MDRTVTAISYRHSQNAVDYIPIDSTTTRLIMIAVQTTNSRILAHANEIFQVCSCSTHVKCKYIISKETCSKCLIKSSTVTNYQQCSFSFQMNNYVMGGVLGGTSKNPGPFDGVENDEY